MSGSGTPATVEAERAGIVHHVHAYEADTGGDVSYGEAAAAALGVPPERVFKTLVAEIDGRPAVAVVPVAGTLDLKALARAGGGKKAAMAAPETAERHTGYVVGGISPLGRRRRLPVYVDDTVTGFGTVYVSAGRRGLQLELDPADLVRLTGASLAPLARTD